MSRIAFFVTFNSKLIAEQVVFIVNCELYNNNIFRYKC